jgi:hypothetical protein
VQALKKKEREGDMKLVLHQSHCKILHYYSRKKEREGDMKLVFAPKSVQNPVSLPVNCNGKKFSPCCYWFDLISWNIGSKLAELTQ